MKKETLKITLCAMFCVAGVLFPMLFHTVSGAGKIFLPMHIPVLLCGFVCGALYGGLCGIITVISSSLMTGMPVPFPNGAVMIFELAAYGSAAGLLYKVLPLKRNIRVYTALIGSMLIGRAVSAFFSFIIYPIAGLSFSFKTFLATSFVTALPGILIQLIFIPFIIVSLSRAHIEISPVKKERL